MPTYYQMAKERDKEKLLEQLQLDYGYFVNSGQHLKFGGEQNYQLLKNAPIRNLVCMSFLQNTDHEPHKLMFGKIVAKVDEFLRLDEINVSAKITLASFIETFKIDTYVS